MGKKQEDGSMLIEYEGNKFHVQKRGEKNALCFLGKDLIKASLIDVPDKSDDRKNLKSKPPTKKDISPDSDDLKRTGRSRGAGED